MPFLSRNLNCELSAAGLAADFAGGLLTDLGVAVRPAESVKGTHPARREAESGLMALTRTADGRMPVCPVPLASCADGALEAYRALSGTRVFPGVSGGELLSERASFTARVNAGAVSSTGHCRLLPTRDGTAAYNLSRDCDWDLLPALFEVDGVANWSAIEQLSAGRDTDQLVSRGRLLGLAVVDARQIPREPCPWVQIVHPGKKRERPDRPPRVVDLASLWAGPLCSSLWQAAGADVTKVESRLRPDGARDGPQDFFRLLNNGKANTVLDLHKKSGQGELLQLIREADIVLEGSRPRALRQMGIIAEELIDEVPGLTWVSITGYGRAEPRGNWIAYGDDAAIAAGLSAIMHHVYGQWLVCGDAIADPLAGIHAALAGWASWLSGGGHLLDLSLERTIRHCIVATAPAGGDFRTRRTRWQQYLSDRGITPLPPHCTREPLSSAR